MPHVAFKAKKCGFCMIQKKDRFFEKHYDFCRNRNGFWRSLFFCGDIKLLSGGLYQVLIFKSGLRVQKGFPVLRQNNAVFMIEMVSVQNLHALFCCVLEKDSLWHFPLFGVIANRYNHISIKLNTEITNLF